MIKYLVVAIVALIFTTNVAEARRHHRAHTARTFAVDPNCNITMPCEGVTASPRGLSVVRAMGGLGVAKQRYTPSTRAERPITRTRVVYANSNTQVVAHPEGCPRSAFCGCGASVRIFGRSVRELWLASNWFKFPRTSPAPGMAAVRNHHVFVLEADLGGGMWQVYDANSGGHATRIHTRSLAGYIVVNPHG